MPGRQWPERARLAGGHPLLLLDQPLAVDAVARERQRLEAPLGNGLAAPLTAAERAVVDLLQRRDDVTQQSTVAVPQLEKELARVGGVGLVAEVLDGVVFLVLAVERGTPDLLRQLAVLLDEADEIFVTGDSVSMLSEAILTGKPVGLVPIEQDEKGRRKLGDVPQDIGPDARRRDLRRFWNYLRDEGLIGTVDNPVAAKVENPVETAARAVRKLLGDLG